MSSADQDKKLLTELVQGVENAWQTLDLETKISELEKLTKQSHDQGFWDNSSRAQATMKTIASLSSQVEPWRKLKNNLHDVAELVTIDDESLQADLHKQISDSQQSFEDLKSQLRFNGQYDDHAAILTLSAGAGGTDAQDWTQILLRMYSRWAEKNNFSVSVIEESSGEEAGWKKVTLELDGPYAYGHLKGEHGVHRLVRLSPFNADSLRQTSFAKAEVFPKIDKPNELEIDDSALKVDVYRADGHGDQSVNTTDSAVRVTHIPTGIVVSIQNERSQLQNKETAMTILRSKLAQLQIEQHQQKVSELKGPNQSAEWGNQIRSYVLHPYKQVKDLRTKHETSNAEAVLDGDIQPFIDAYLETRLG